MCISTVFVKKVEEPWCCYISINKQSHSSFSAFLIKVAAVLLRRKTFCQLGFLLHVIGIGVANN